MLSMTVATALYEREMQTVVACCICGHKDAKGEMVYTCDDCCCSACAECMKDAAKRQPAASESDDDYVENDSVSYIPCVCINAVGRLMIAERVSRSTTGN